jgi:hypothetical protein
MAGTFKHGNEISGSIKGGKLYHDQLGHYQFLMEQVS